MEFIIVGGVGKGRRKTHNAQDVHKTKMVQKELIETMKRFKVAQRVFLDTASPSQVLLSLYGEASPQTEYKFFGEALAALSLIEKAERTCTRPHGVETICNDRCVNAKA